MHYSPYRRPLFIVYAVVIAVVLYSIYYLFRYFPPTTVHAAEDTLTKLQRALRVNAEIGNTAYVDWFEAGKDALPLRSKQFALGVTRGAGVGKYGNIQNSDLLIINDRFLKRLRDEIFIFYKEQGFSEDPANSQTSPDVNGVTRMGFQKNGVYCVTTFMRHSDPFADVSCGVTDKRQQILQRRVYGLVRELEESSQRQTRTSRLHSVFRVKKLEGSFAAGSMSGYSGYHWIARKTNGKWKIIWRGQDIPLCSDLRIHRVPKSLSQGCLNLQH